MDELASGGRLPIIGLYGGEPDTVLPLVGEAVPLSNVRVCPTAATLLRTLDGLDVLLAFHTRRDPFPCDQILRARTLRWVQLASTGIDHLLPIGDEEIRALARAAREDPERRLVITNASGVDADAVADYVLMAILVVARRWDRMLIQHHAREWAMWRVPPVSQASVCVVGTGQIGQAVARRARCVGMRVHGVSRSGRPLEEFDEVSTVEQVGDAVATADFIVITAPLTTETHHMIDDSVFSRVKPSAWLIHVSRGGVVDEAALHRALTTGGLAGAVVDVFEEEPLPADSPLWRLPNMIVTPHMSSHTLGRMAAVACLFRDNLRRWLAGDPLVNLVQPARGY